MTKHKLTALHFDGFHVYIPAFMVDHLMHRLAGQNPALPLFLRDRNPGAGRTAPMRVVLQVYDRALMVTDDDFVERRRQESRELAWIPLTMGLCTITVVGPTHPFQAIGISPAQDARATTPATTLSSVFIDERNLQPWDPSKASTNAGPSRGFELYLDSTNPEPPLGSPVAHVGEPPPMGSDLELISWYSRELAGP